MFAELEGLQTERCPFTNLPEKTAGRWGQGITAAKMAVCIWVKPKVVVQVNFLQWTEGDKLRHTTFVGLRRDKDPKKVVRET